MYGQQDPNWRDQVLGFGPLTIGQAGCYLTAFTNLANVGGAGITPPQLNQVFQANNRFVNGDELTDQAMNGLFGCNYVETRWFSNEPADLNYPQDPQGDEYAIEIWINNNPSRTHFVLYYDGHAADDFRIVDSWDGAVVNLKDRYGDPATIIQKFVYYKVNMPSPQPAPVPEPAPAPQPEPQPTPEPTPAPEPEPEGTGQVSADNIPVTIEKPIHTIDPVEATVKVAALVVKRDSDEPVEVVPAGAKITLSGYYSKNGRTYYVTPNMVSNNLEYGIDGQYLETPGETPDQPAAPQLEDIPSRAWRVWLNFLHAIHPNK